MQEFDYFKFTVSYFIHNLPESQRSSRIQLNFILASLHENQFNIASLIQPSKFYLSDERRLTNVFVYFLEIHLESLEWKLRHLSIISTQKFKFF